MKICPLEYTKGAPCYEQKELRSSGKHRRCGFANGAGELIHYAYIVSSNNKNDKDWKN